MSAAGWACGYVSAVKAAWTEAFQAGDPGSDYYATRLGERARQRLVDREEAEEVAEPRSGPRYGMTCVACDGDLAECGCWDDEGDAPGHHCDCGLSADMEDLDTHSATCTVWDDPTCYFCGDPTGTVRFIADHDDAEFVCDGCADDELAPAAAAPTLVDVHAQRWTQDTSAAGTVPPVPAAEGTTELSWDGWAVPAIQEVLAEHQPTPMHYSSNIGCAGPSTGLCDEFEDWQDWREHVSELIAERIACDPVRAAQALKAQVARVDGVPPAFTHWFQK